MGVRHGCHRPSGEPAAAAYEEGGTSRLVGLSARAGGPWRHLARLVALSDYLALGAPDDTGAGSWSNRPPVAAFLDEDREARWGP